MIRPARPPFRRLPAACPAALFALAALALLVPSAPAQEGAGGPAPPAGRISVAVVDTGKAIDASRQGKAAASRVQSRYAQLDKKIQGLQKDAQARAEELSREAEGLTPEEFEKRRGELQKEVDSIQAETSRAEADLKSAAEEAYGPLYDRAAALASDHAGQHGYVMVLENSDEDKAVIFADQKVVFIDITADVTAALDSGAKGSPKTPSGTSRGRRPAGRSRR